MSFKKSWERFLFKTETVTSIIIAIIVFFIFGGDTSFLERTIYALIVGGSCFLMVFVFKFTLVWFYQALKGKIKR